jgi:hypothetical protein
MYVAEEVSMSDERMSDFDVFQKALTSEEFRRRLTEVDQLELQYEIESLCPAVRQRYTQTNGEEVMTKQDMQRQTLRDALAKSGFHDEQMKQFAESPSFELGDVLSRAKTLAAQPEHPDVRIAGDIVVMIRNFT